MSDRGIIYVTAPTLDHSIDKIIDILADNGCLFGPPMRLTDGRIEYGLEVSPGSCGAIIDRLRSSGFTIGGGVRP